jgi:hypothetical protein
MPVVPYTNRLEPANDAAIWRFMDLRKFRDLVASEELYFRRADLFKDKSEGLPPDEYAMRVLGLNPYDIRDRAELNNHLGSLAQHRESYYISCWCLFRQETLDMWEQYGHDGVAVCSRYELLTAALDGLLATRLVSRSTISLPVPSLAASLKSGKSESLLALASGAMIFLLI